eukprot:5869797-Alexandrium_andersonii.AAC.1
MPPSCSGEVVARNCCVKGNGCCHDCEGCSREARELGGSPINQASESAPNVAIRDRHGRRPQVLEVPSPAEAEG